MRVGCRSLSALIVAMCFAPTLADANDKTNTEHLFVERIHTLTQQPDLIKPRQVARLLDIPQQGVSLEWTRISGLGGVSYQLVWPNQNPASGITEVKLTYSRDLSGDGIDNVDLTLSGTPCIRASNIAAGARAQIEYATLPGLAEPWAPAPAPVNTDRIMSIKLDNQNGSNVTIDTLLSFPTSDCLSRLRMWTDGGAKFVDQPPA